MRAVHAVIPISTDEARKTFTGTTTCGCFVRKGTLVSALASLGRTTSGKRKGMATEQKMN